MIMTPVDLDSLSKDELKERHLDLLERFHALEERMMALKDELARLKAVRVVRRSSRAAWSPMLFERRASLLG
jgi:uncharacterized small protein (DUF1192 family)